jgi:mono/diheme cytochrome c family protein
MSRSFPLLALFIGLGTLAGIAHAEEPIDPNNTHLYLKGHFVYDKMCVTCHGRRGRGDGEWATDLTDKPRDFRTGVFKFRSTPCGFLPTDQDLIRTIRGGISGTAMPAFTNLTDQDVEALIVFLKNLSRRWDDPNLQTKPLTIPEVPDWFFDEKKREANAAKGHETFKINCVICHGTKGDGKGPGAEALKDIWGHVITPGNLTLMHHKSGDSAQDLYRTIALGLDGTPMVGYEAALDPANIWNLIAFIRSLETEANVYGTGNKKE